MLMSGCGSGGGDGPKRFDLSGTVTYQGKPVPVGVILLEPDTEKGNSGPGTLADITNGTYRTPPGKGVVGGPYLFRVQGYDGIPITHSDMTTSDQGKVLFSEQTLFRELPKQNAVENLEISSKGN